MRRKSLDLALALGLFVFAGLACNFSASTANISGLKLGKDKDVSTEMSSFSAGDTVYGLATISNAPGAVTVKGRLIVVEAEGMQSGPVPDVEPTVKLEGSGTASFNFSPSSAGWPKGKYKIEVVMLNENGEQKDQKSADFTIS